MATLACDRVGRRTLFLVSYFVAFVSLCMASAAMIYGGEFEDDDSSSKEDWSCGTPISGPKNQVWHKTQSMTTDWVNTFLFCSSHQLPALRQGPLTHLVFCLRNCVFVENTLFHTNPYEKSTDRN